jgi:hypothetical protein
VVFSDGPRNAADVPAVTAVREVVRQSSGFARVVVHEASTNRGLAQSIISGVSDVVSQYGKLIVLEDDLVSSRHFLYFMNEGLSRYEHRPGVVSIHGYCYPTGEPLPETFFLRGADCWGWGTWERAWRLFNPDGRALLAELNHRRLTRDFDLDGWYPYTRMLKKQVAGVNDSWAIRWHASAFLANGLTLYPGQSLVRNIGNDLSGTHSRHTEQFDSKPVEERVMVTEIPVEECAQARRAFGSFLARQRGTILHRAARYPNRKYVGGGMRSRSQA